LLLCAVQVQAQPRVKLSVAETDLYEVTGRELAEAGAGLGAPARDMLALSCAGQSAPFRILSAGEAVTADTRLRFWGQAAESKFTRTNAYWLTTGGAGNVMALQDAVPTAGAAPVRSVRSRARFEENREYAYLLQSPDKAQADHWLWHKVPAKRKAEASFDLPDAVGGEASAIWVESRGSTSPPAQPNHHTVIEINGQVVDDAQWSGAVLRRFEGPLPAGLLKPAGNVLTLSNPGDTPAGDVDTVYLKAFEVTYQRSPIARRGELDFYLGPSTAPQTVDIAGFAGPAELYDITDPTAPVLLQATPGDDGVLRVTVACETERHLVAVAEPAVKHPAVALVRDSGLRAPTNGADYLAAAPEAFVPALEPLLELRRKQGLRVVVAPVQAVYDDFGDGLATPLAIRELVRYAAANWQEPAPTDSCINKGTS
jgi:hypothetical protein